MMSRVETNYLSGSMNPKSLYEILKYKKNFNNEHPNYFYPDGLLVFCGNQGSGKTLSAVQYVKKLMKSYPMALLCTNVEITTLSKEEKERTIEYNGIQSLKELENGEKGIIYLIQG